MPTIASPRSRRDRRRTAAAQRHRVGGAPSRRSARREFAGRCARCGVRPAATRRGSTVWSSACKRRAIARRSSSPRRACRRARRFAPRSRRPALRTRRTRRSARRRHAAVECADGVSSAAPRFYRRPERPRRSRRRRGRRRPTACCTSGCGATRRRGSSGARSCTPKARDGAPPPSARGCTFRPELAVKSPPSAADPFARLADDGRARAERARHGGLHRPFTVGAREGDVRAAAAAAGYAVAIPPKPRGAAAAGAAHIERMRAARARAAAGRRRRPARCRARGAAAPTRR